MSQIFITGDTHGELQLGRLSSKGWPLGRTLTKNDFVIICGDFGLIWDNVPGKTEQYWTKWLNEKPWTTFAIDGNHENHPRLQALPIEEKFGSKVGKISDSIYYLRRGEIYTINDKTFFCFGGAMSHDKHFRKLNVSWWEEEVASFQEQEYAIENLKKHNNKVDYIITHTVPSDLLSVLGLSAFVHGVDATGSFLNFIVKEIQYEHWFCGHLHMDKDMGKFSILWDKIMKVL